MAAQQGTTQRTDAEFVDHLERLHERLVTHTASLGSGRLSAVDDLAAVLRVLVARGRGDDTLRRTVRRFHLSEPTVAVGPPVQRQRHLVVAFGGMPAHPVVGVPSPVEPEVMSSSQWAESLALAKEGLFRDYYTWEQLITAYANSNGSHFSSSVQDVLRGITMHDVGDLDLGAYLMWGAASIASDALRDLLRQLSREVGDEGTPPPPGVLSMAVALKPSGNPDLAVTFRLGREGPLMTIPARDLGSAAQTIELITIYSEQLPDGQFRVWCGVKGINAPDVPPPPLRLH